MADADAVELPQPHPPVNGEADTTAPLPKRKHDEELRTHIPAPPTDLQQQDLLETLKSHDSESLILDHEFQDRSTAPRSKRAKTSNATSHTSIAEKLSSRRYTHWTDIVGDAEMVKDDIIRSVRQKDASPDTQQTDVRPSIEELKRIQRATAITSLVVDIVSGEMEKSSIVEPSTAIKEEPPELSSSTNGIKQPSADMSGTVLTLFGNAPTPKQLFSSLQSSNAAASPTVVKTELPIEEMNLPNGLTATRIRPSSVAPTATKPTTFAEAFAAPFALPHMSPPRPSKRTTSKDNVLTWDFKSPSKSSKRGGFTTQPLAVADWLSYGVGEARHDSLSPLEKRKQRDRALSSSKSPGLSARDDISFAAELDRQEDALFQRAYSSFAPAFDNSRSLVDASVKNMVWWHKIGNRHFNERFAGEYALGAFVPLPERDADGTSETQRQEKDFARAVEEYSEPDDVPVEEELDLTNVDTVLRKIADLLQTLASYQWIRNANLPSSTSAARPSTAHGSVISGKTEKPEEPSGDEVEVYEQLRREIAFLVLQLPPYAVAKIDGDQLAELGVSKYITFNTATYKGQLEEDQVARMSRYTAAATAASVASLTRSNQSNNPHYSSSSRTPAIGQSANTRYGQHSGYGSARSSFPASSAQRQSTGSYGTPTAPPRGQYSQAGQYNRPGLPHQTSSYNQANSAQYQQRSGYGGYANYGSSNNQGTPQSQPRPGNYQQSYQQRSQTAAANAVAYQTQQGGTYNSAQSPGKPGNVTASGTIAQQLGHQYQPGSGRNTPANHASPAQTPVNGLQQARAPPPLVPRTNTPQPSPVPNPVERPASSSNDTAQAVNGHA